MIFVIMLCFEQEGQPVQLETSGVTTKEPALPIQEQVVRMCSNVYNIIVFLSVYFPENTRQSLNKRSKNKLMLKYEYVYKAK